MDGMFVSGLAVGCNWSCQTQEVGHQGKPTGLVGLGVLLDVGERRSEMGWNASGLCRGQRSRGRKQRGKRMCMGL